MKSLQFINGLLFISFALICQNVSAVNLQVSVVDDEKNPVEFAVIYIKESLPKVNENSVTIDQVDKEFIPYVTVIQRGSAINFPNNDDIRHQVYSFSKSKQFELPIYSGN